VTRRLLGRRPRGAARRPLRAVLPLLPRASRAGTAALLVEVVAAGLLPVVLALATGSVVASVAGEETSALPGVDSPWVALGIVAAAFAVLQVGLPFLAPAREGLAHRLDLLVRRRVMAALLRPATVAHLEDPKLADEVRLARTVATDMPDTDRTLGALAAIGSARLMAAASGLVLVAYRWWAPLVIAGAWYLSHGWHRREMGSLVESFEQSTDDFRRAQYVSELALGGPAAKEVRLFGLGGWLIDRFRRHCEIALDDVWRHRRQHRWQGTRAIALVTTAHFAVLAFLVSSAVRGEIGIGELAVYAQAVVAMVGFSWDADSEYLLAIGTAPLSHVPEVERAVAATQFVLPGEHAPEGAPEHGIYFRNVRFAYPGSAAEVLRGLDLWIPEGRSLAIVGDNGSGKTTLLKLLCRFYDPTDGAVCVDGIDLRYLDPAGWQQTVAAVFQDFGRYPLPARDNVGFGSLRLRDDGARLAHAAARAGALAVVDRLPAGWDTPLSRQLTGGAELSGGQWQRIALARVLLAVEGGARVLILDEPTASLDIRAEAEFYDRFLELTKGITTILVSHRFSTVRRADRIVVLESGEVAEEGTHDELLAVPDGRYRAMYEGQAARFRH
jgi:ATP-binding cassette subfamily B protein